jgi:hypothetical protein
MKTKKSQTSKNQVKSISPHSDGNKVVIRDVIVADPSISFTIVLNERDFKKSKTGYYLTDFQVQVMLNKLPSEETTSFTPIAQIVITSVSQLGLYFYVPFGDPKYVAGTKFKLKLVLTGLDPVTGDPVVFNEGKPYSMDVYGGGVPGVQ